MKNLFFFLIYIIVFFLLTFTNFGLNCFFKVALSCFPKLHIKTISGNIKNIVLKNIVYKSNQLQFSINKIHINLTKKILNHNYIYVDLICAKNIFINSKTNNFNINKKTVIFNIINNILFKRFELICPNIKLYQIYYKNNHQHLFIDKCFVGLRSTKKNITFYTLKTNKIQLKIKSKKIESCKFLPKNIVNIAKKIFNFKIFFIKYFFFCQYENIFVNNFKENFFSIIENKKLFVISTDINFIKKKHICIIQKINLKFCNFLINGNGFFLLNKKNFINILLKINFYVEKVLKEETFSFIIGNTLKKTFFYFELKGYKNIIFNLYIRKKQTPPYYEHKMLLFLKDKIKNKKKMYKNFNIISDLNSKNNLLLFNVYTENNKKTNKKNCFFNYNLNEYNYYKINNLLSNFLKNYIYCKTLINFYKIIKIYKYFIFQNMFTNQNNLILISKNQCLLNNINNLLIKTNFLLKKNDLNSIGSLFIFFNKNYIYIPGINYFFLNNHVFIKASINNNLYIFTKIKIKSINKLFRNFFGSIFGVHKILFNKNHSTLKTLSKYTCFNFIYKLFKMKKLYFTSKFFYEKHSIYNLSINLFNISINKNPYYSTLVEFNKNINSNHIFFQIIQKKLIININITNQFKKTKLKKKTVYINIYLKVKK